MRSTRIDLLPLTLLLSLLLVMQGCGGDEAGVCENVQCPGGYHCVDVSGKGTCKKAGTNPDLGPVKDIGPRLDKKKPPKQDKGPNKDTGPGKDKKVQPKDLPGKLDGNTQPKDTGSSVDQPVGGPVSVTLLSPANNSKTALVEVKFMFNVSSANKIAKCELFMNTKLSATLPNPKATDSFVKKGLKDGKYTWSIKCTDSKGKAGGSAIWTVTISPETLTKCKTSGFKANTRYKVLLPVLSTGGDCFVVDASGVHLDGNSKAVAVARYKDLLVHQGKALYPSVYKNPGVSGSWTKTWTTPYKQTVGTGPTAADFNGDGRLDLVIPTQSDRLRIYSAKSAGAFNTTPYYTSKEKMLRRPRAVDWNQDGAMDLLAGGYNTKEEFALNKGLAGLMYQTAYNWGSYTTDLDVGDFNGDRVLDAAAGGGFGFGNDKRVLMRGYKSSSSFGFFTLWTASNNDVRGSGPTLMGDLDSDGDLDLLLPFSFIYNQRYSRTFLNSGTGYFKKGASFSGTRPVAIADMNGDGKPDLVLVTLTGSMGAMTSIQVKLNNGKGGFSSLKSLSPGGTITSILVRDLNGDGLPELVVGTSSSSYGYLRVYKNTLKTSSSFTLSYSYGSKGSSYIWDARDMNNDSRLDLVFGAFSTFGTVPYLMVGLQSVSGSFLVKVAYSGKVNSGVVSGTVLGDLDGQAARGVHIKKGASKVTVSNVGPIRGFSTGVLVEGDQATLEGVEVVDPDLYGVRFDGVNTGKVDSLKVKQLFQGTALSLDNAKIITVNNSNLCDMGRHPNFTPVGAACVLSAANGTNNRLNLNNGCTTLASKYCP